MKLNKRHMIYIAVFAALLLLLYLLLVVSAAIPNSAILKKMHQSAYMLSNEDPYVFTEDQQYQNITDNLADQMWLNIGWHMGNSNPFISALNTRYYDGDLYGPAVGLYMSVTRGHDANTDYTRYWHGTAGVMRILHLLFNIHGIRTLGMLCLIFLVGRTLWILYRTGHWDMALCLLVSLLLVQIGNLRMSAEYQPCFLICFALCPAFLKLERQGDFYLNLLAIISGTLTAFFDFLTTETVPLLIPLILVIGIRSLESRLKSPRRVMKTLLRCSICWVLAYLGTFAAKWCVVSLITGGNHLGAAMQSVGQRISGVVTEDATQQIPGFFMAIGSNFSVLFEGTSRTEYRNAVSKLVLIAILLLLVYRMYQVRQRMQPGTVFILLLGGVVLLRFGLLANHSYMHSFFTYRAFVSTIFAVLMAMLINLRPPKKGGVRVTWN